MAELGVGMSKWRQVRIDEIADKNAKKGFIFLRLPEVQLDVTICDFKKRQNEFTAKGVKD
jgi:hypothetical protein